MTCVRCWVVACVALFAGVVRADPEPLRPRYHFTADRGYINDPNGLFFLDGTYHLFFQRGDTRSKAWGHATSTDLLHWTQHPDALTPVNGRPVCSGSAVIDRHNTTGFGTPESPPVVAVFTEWGLGQALAYSTDRGASWTRYAANPVLRLPGDAKRSFALSARDPHVMWDEDRRRWVMVLYHNREQVAVAESDDGRHRLGFSVFTSPDLKLWTYRSRLDDFYVCPDVFRLPVEGTGRMKWVAMVWERYAVGEFDGETFTAEQPIRPLDHGANLSANQSWKNLPDGRTIQICWLRGGKYPGMPFNQQLSVPTELSLRRGGGDIRLCKVPVRELASLRGEIREVKDRTLYPGKPLSFDMSSQCYDVSFDLKLGRGDELQIRALGQDITVSNDKIAAMGKTYAPAEPVSDLRVLADITSLELFVNRGEATMSFALLPPTGPAGVTVSASRGEPRVILTRVAQMKSTRE